MATTTPTLPSTYKALVATEYGQMPTLTTLPMPTATPGSAIVQILATPCDKGSLGFLDARNPEFSNEVPFIPGVSAVGRIVTTGPDATTLRPGKLVLLEPFVKARDDPDNAQIIKALFAGPTPEAQVLAQPGLWRDGFWAEYVHVALENCVPLDEKVLLGAAEEGGLGYDVVDIPHLAPLLVAYGGFRSVGLKAGETVLVAPGTGWYSGAAVEVAAAMGARVIAVGRNQDTLKRLTEAVPRVQGVQLTGDEVKDQEVLAKFGPIDVVMDFTPMGTENPLYLRSGIAALATNGRAVLMGFAYGDLAANYSALVIKNLTIKGKYMYEREDITGVVKLVESGLLKLGKQAGQQLLAQYKFEDFEKAIGQSAELGPWGQQVFFCPV